MKIKNNHLKQLLDTNLIEYNYNEQIANRMLQSVSLHICNAKHLVEITFDKDNLLETNIWLNENDEITLSEPQLNFLYEFFETLFAERESDDMNYHCYYQEQMNNQINNIYYIR